MIELEREKRILNTYYSMCATLQENFREFGFVAPVVFFLSEEYGIQFYNVYEAWKKGVEFNHLIHEVRDRMKKLNACAVIFVQEIKTIEEGVEKRKASIRLEYIGDDGKIKGLETVYELDTERREILSVERSKIEEFIFFTGLGTYSSPSN